MIVDADSVVASLKEPVMTQSYQGIGRIININNSWFLQTSTDRIPLDMPANGFFNGNEVCCYVRYSINNKNVYLFPLAAEHPDSASIQKDIFTSSTVNASDTSVNIFSVNSFSSETEIPEGIYLFISADELESFFDSGNSEEARVRALQCLAENGEVAVKVEKCIEGTARIVILTKSDVSLSLAALRATFLSPALSSVPIDVWEQLLSERGELPFAILHDLDLLLGENGISFPPLRAGSCNARNNAIIQWLHAVFAAGRPSPDFAACVPYASASDMISDLAEIIKIVRNGNGKPSPIPEAYTITDSSIPSISSVSELIPQAIQSIGFTLENSLSSADLNGNYISAESSLKSLLLHLCMLADTKENLHQTESGSGDTKQFILRPSESRNPLPPDITGHCGILIDQLTALRGELASGIKMLLEPKNPGNIPAETSEDAEEQIKNNSLINNQIPSSLKDIIKNIKETVIGLSVRLSSVAGEAENGRWLFGINRERVAFAVKYLLSVVDQITSLTDDHFHAMRAVSENEISGPAYQAVFMQQSFKPLTVLLGTLIKTVDSIIKFFGVESQSRAGNDRMVTESNNEQPEPAVSNRSAIDSDNSLLSASLRQTALGRALSDVLDRFESLQLLARQVATSQGNQQIIALPVKFGDGWTEVNIRLLRRRMKRRSKKSSDRFVVDVDVAPPALGPLHAHIDYHRARKLCLSVGFERKAACEWFRRHSDELTGSIRAGGFANVSLDFSFVMQKEERSAGNGNFSKKNGIIDLIV